jgi:hypothetical protein
MTAEKPELWRTVVSRALRQRWVTAEKPELWRTVVSRGLRQRWVTAAQDQSGSGSAAKVAVSSSGVKGAAARHA